MHTPWWPRARSVPKVLLALLLACGGSAPSGKDFTLTAPSSVVAVPGRSVTLALGLARRGGLEGPIALEAVGLPSGVTASFSGATGDSASLTLALAQAAQAGSFTVKASAEGVERSATVELKLAQLFKSPTGPSPIRVTLDKLFYRDGDAVSAVVDFGTLTPPTELPKLVLASGDSRDAEALELVKGEGNSYRTSGALAVKAGAAAPGDGALQLAPGNTFFAFYTVDKAQPSLAAVEATLVSDFAFFDGDGGDSGAPVVVDARFALNPEEATAVVPTGTLVARGQLPVQLASRQLILTSESPEEVARFLAATSGTVLDELPVADAQDPRRTTLVEVNPEPMYARTPRLRAFLGEAGELAGSTRDVIALYGLALAMRLEGFAVSVNPRLQPDGPPVLAEAANLRSNMQALGVAGSTSCTPNSTSNPCVRSAPAVWSYLALMDRDTRPIRFGILDYGFAPNDDFRRDPAGEFTECDVTVRPMRCAAGAARGIPTVRASGVGGFVWHGTSGVTGIAGRVNDGFGGAGVGGQVGVPMLYKYDTVGFVFEVGRGLRRAVDDGASVINLSAGYPCGVVTTVGPDLDLCTPEGRGAICAVVAGAATAAAVAFCTSPLAAIPIAGAIACGALTGVAITTTGACLTAVGANLALGNPGGPMRAALQYAKAQGVPVVVSAGNVIPRESLPEVIRDYVDLSERRTERWHIIPANLPESITVGAANEALGNEEFFGDRVDVWAPIYTAYFSPSSATDPASPLVVGAAGGTSAAAPYVAGTILAMQAANPGLDPRAVGTTPAQRREGVERIRGLLRSTAWTNAQLAGLGYADQPVERRNLINPLGAVQAAGAGLLPDLAALGFDTTLNFADDGSDDVVAGAKNLLSTGVAGTIFTLPPAVGAPPAAERDWYSFANSDGTLVNVQEFTVRWATSGIEQPAFEFNRTTEALQQVSVVATGDTKLGTYRFFSRERTGAFAVTAAAGSDFPYRITAGTKAPAPVSVSITEPVLTAGDTFCVNETVRFSASAFYTGTSLPATLVTWLVNGATVATGASFTTSFGSVGTRTVTARAGASSAVLTVPVEACTVSVRITTPSGNVSAYPNGSDAFLAVSLRGEVRDANGNVLPAAGYTFEWVTDRADVQPGAPATGSQVVATGNAPNSVPFYAEGGQVSTVHRVTLVVRQGGVVVGTSPARLITVLQLI